AGKSGNLSGSDDEALINRKLAYLENLKKQYKVMGLPAVFVLSPSGEVLAKYRGYQTGNGEFYWGRIKNTIIVSQKERERWRESMMAKGYREWRGNNGVTLLAKLVRYHKGDMLMVEPDGNRIRTSENQLSPDDQLWLANEKKKRGLQ
ncbi:MAG: hypothetical protein ACQKBY_01700, partial [Verrucomicrobiales bacterium]